MSPLTSAVARAVGVPSEAWDWTAGRKLPLPLPWKKSRFPAALTVTMSGIPSPSMSAAITGPALAKVVANCPAAAKVPPVVSSTLTMSVDPPVDVLAIRSGVPSVVSSATARSWTGPETSVGVAGGESAVPVAVGFEYLRCRSVAEGNIVVPVLIEIGGDDVRGAEVWIGAGDGGAGGIRAVPVAGHRNNLRCSSGIGHQQDRQVLTERSGYHVCHRR